MIHKIHFHARIPAPGLHLCQKNGKNGKMENAWVFVEFPTSCSKLMENLWFFIIFDNHPAKLLCFPTILVRATVIQWKTQQFCRMIAHIAQNTWVFHYFQTTSHQTFKNPCVFHFSIFPFFWHKCPEGDLASRAGMDKMDCAFCLSKTHNPDRHVRKTMGFC